MTFPTVSTEHLRLRYTSPNLLRKLLNAQPLYEIQAKKMKHKVKVIKAIEVNDDNNVHNVCNASYRFI